MNTLPYTNILPYSTSDLGRCYIQTMQQTPGHNIQSVHHNEFNIGLNQKLLSHTRPTRFLASHYICNTLYIYI